MFANRTLKRAGVSEEALLGVKSPSRGVRGDKTRIKVFEVLDDFTLP